MPRREGTPPLTRGTPCVECGGDAWRRRNDTGKWTCAPCTTRRATAHLRRRRSADPARPMWEMARVRARQNGVPCTVTLDEVRAAWPADGRCPVLGIELRRGTSGHLIDASPSLDRLNPAWGYEPGNVAVISMRANRAKGNCTAAELEAIAAWMRRCGLD